MNTFFTDLYYYPLKLCIVIDAHLYFRKLRATGLKNIPSKGPVIYAINHQNSLLDAFVCHAFSWRNPYFLTRADVFNNKFIDKFLRGVKMLPIYRIRDGRDSMKKNDQIFESTKEILADGGVVGIFPEGSHSLTHKLRPLKKGIARIAFMTDAAADFKLKVQIVPIGIHYESYFSPKGRTLVTCGKPISVADYKQTYLKDESKAFNELLAELSLRMKSLILNIESKDYDQVYEDFERKRVYKSSLKEQLKSDQALVRCIEQGNEFEETSDKPNIILRFFANIGYMLRFVVGFIPKSIVNFMVKKLVKDKHFIGTMKYTYSMIVYPVFFIVLYYVVKVLAF
jgi:1-acyl-sn-glycerol-3-phosphate acyltransferase